MDVSGLAERARRGDRAAFEKIVQSTARLVYAQIVSRVRDRQKAEDLTQETFVAAWKGIGTLQSKDGFISWLLTLARNVTLDGIKREQRLKRGGTGGGPPKGTPNSGVLNEAEIANEETPGDKAALAEESEWALKVLEELPEEYRDVLRMRYLAGADYQTICGALGLSDGALRGLLNRGMAMMRERMTSEKQEARSKK